MDNIEYGTSIGKTNDSVSDVVTPELILVKVEPQEFETFSKSDKGSNTAYSMDCQNDMDNSDEHIKTEREDGIDLNYEDIKTEIVNENNVTDDMTQDANLLQVADPLSMDYHDDMDIIDERIKTERDDEIDFVYEDIKTKIVNEDNGYILNDMTPDVKLLHSDVFDFHEQRQISSNYFNRNDYLEHHVGENAFKCGVCLKVFAHTSSLRRHERTHTGERSFQCEVCLKSFTTTSSLKIHERTHTGEKPFECTVCSKSFTRKHHLRGHERTHTGERPFQCNVCSKSFTDSSTLKVHERSHSGEKPFQCTICSKSFATKTYLKVHERIHTGEKPFECTVCSKSFTRIHHLRGHERTHTGERPFQCEICLKFFTRTSALKVHKKGHTRSESVLEVD
ncbi:uncharacterized protein [Leptinotarsa decemlineata]|uniref:uncharacterized protein n=1 Tax=Leptinotarsa decemlineata TaxID=7539 RepID=UPI003D30A83F